jgi:3-dehydrotetronate 4-kinase
MQIGVIADDITGATDVALMLGKRGGSVVQVIGVPKGPLPNADAVVISLKSRSNPVAEAVAQSLAACTALQQAGARQIMFKYCSTFDSTDEGNIGPVIDALMKATGARMTVATPAFPANGRTVFQGHLFVGTQLLSDSPMKDHPLTPMRDSNLVAVLGRQTKRKVGLLAYHTVDAGAGPIAAGLAAAGAEIVIVDAILDRHLIDLGAAIADLPLVTGGSGIALGLAPLPKVQGGVAQYRPASGPKLILAGSCSARTRAQVATAMAAGLEAFQIDPDAIDAAAAIEWAKARLSDAPILIYSSADPADVTKAKAANGLGVAERLEAAFGDIGAALAASGVRKLIVAGGETSGAVFQALGITQLAIGPEIAPGVPWTRSLDHLDLILAAKSGNFGAEDFFLTAWDAAHG